VACQQLGNPPQLANRYAERDYDEAPDRGRDAGIDKCISEAKFVDRNAKSDHHQPRHKGESADAEEHYRHTL
jgi:hypothetical protein